MPTVDVPSIGLVKFPDEMSPDDISGAIRSHFEKARTAGLDFAINQAPGLLLDVGRQTRAGLDVQDQMQQEEGAAAAALRDLPPTNALERAQRNVERFGPRASAGAGVAGPESELPGGSLLSFPTDQIGLPRLTPPPEAGVTEKIASGVYNTAAGALNFPLSLEGLATVMGGEVLPATATKALFAGLLTKGASEAAGRASVTKDPGDITEAALAALPVPFLAKPEFYRPPPIQGPPAVGALLNTPRGAAPEATAAEILRASPEEAAARAEQMTQEATFGNDLVSKPAPSRLPLRLREKAPKPEVPVVGPSIEEQRAAAAASDALKGQAQEQAPAGWSDFVDALKARGKGNETVAQIQAMFPEQRMNREAARRLGRDAFGEQWRRPGKGNDGAPLTPPAEPTPPPATPPAPPAPPAAPAAPEAPGATEITPDMAGARSVLQMTPDQFRKSAQGFNKVNLDIGRNASPAEVVELQSMADQVKQRWTEAMARAAASGADADLQAVADLGSMHQFFNEAVREAKERPEPPKAVKQAFNLSGADLMPPQVQPKLHGTALESKNPLGLRVAAKTPTGEIVSGKPGELHFNLKFPAGSDLGFVTKDGKYLTREEASKAQAQALGQTKPTLPQAGQELIEPGPVTSPGDRANVARARIVNVLEQIEDEDPKTGQVTSREIPEDEWPAHVRLAAQALGEDWGYLLQHFDQDSLRKLLRNRLGAIEQEKAGKGSLPNLPDEPKQMPTPGLALIRSALQQFNDKKLGGDQLLDRYDEITSEHDQGIPDSLEAAARNFAKELGTEDELKARHAFLTELAKATGEKAPEPLPAEVAPEPEPEPPTPPAPAPEPAKPVEAAAPAPAPEPEPEPVPAAPVEAPPTPETLAQKHPAVPQGLKDTAAKARLALKAAEQRIPELESALNAIEKQRNGEGNTPATLAALAKKEKSLLAEWKKLKNDTGINGELQNALDEANRAMNEARYQAEVAPYRNAPSPEGAQPVTSKMLKEQKASLLDQARAALKTAPEQNTKKITLSVPGDGDFSIFHNKEALKKFIATIESSFPDSVSKPKGPGLGPREGKTMPAATAPKAAKGKTMGETLGAIVGEFTSTDQSRFAIQTAYADGTQIVATDGRRMIRVVSSDAPGKLSAPVRLSPTGKEARGEGKFPNYKQIWESKPTLVKGGVPTADLWTVANQAIALVKGLKDKTPQIDLFLNPDGTLGAKSNQVEVGSYEHNIKPGAKGIGRYNAEYIFDAANALRKLGNEKADLYFHGDPGPLEMRGKNGAVITMGMAEAGKPINVESGRPAAGKAEHGNLPEMHGPLNHPDAEIYQHVGSGNASFDVTLENGEFEIKKNTAAKDKYSETKKDKIADFKLSDLAERAKIAAVLKEKGLSPTQATEVLKAMSASEKERNEIIAEGKRREASESKLSEKATAYLDKAAEEALNRIKSRPPTHLGTTGDPIRELANIKDYAIYGAAKLAKLGVRGAEWTAEMVQAFGKKIEPHLDKIYDASKRYLEDYKAQALRVPKPTSIQEIINTHAGAEPVRPGGITGAIDSLQSSLRTVRALKEHFERQPAVSKAEVKQADNWLEADANRIRESLTELVKSELPPAERGRFITAINNATRRAPILTGDPAAMYRHAAQVAARIEERSAEVRKGAAIDDLQKMVRRAISSPSVDLGYKKRILELMRRVSFTKPTAETLANLKSTRAYLDRMAEQGKDVEIPREILDQLEVLTKVPLRDLPPEAVHALADKINQLEQLGRLKVEMRQRVWDAEKNSKLNELSKEDTNPYEKNPLLRHQPGDTDSLSTKLRNLVRRTQNAAGILDKALMPIDALFDMLGDAKGDYRGWLFRHVRGPLDLGFNAASVMKENISDPVVELVKKYNMGQREGERINTYARAMQENGVERLIAEGVDPQRIEEIVKGITGPEREVYQAMRAAMDGLLPSTQKLMHELYNIDVKPEENYWPLPRDLERNKETLPPKDAAAPETGSTMSFDDLAGWKDLLADFGPGRTTKTERGFTIERKKGALTPVKNNAFDVFYQHINDVTYLLKTQRDLKMIGEMARNDLFQNKYGKAGQQLVIDFLDTFARQGKGMHRIPWLDELRTRTSAGAIGLRVASQFVHASNISLAMERAGPMNYKDALMEIASGKAEQFIKDNFAEAFSRGGGEHAFVEAAAKDMSVFGKTIVPKELTKASFAVARAIDRVNAEATMLGVYFKELKRKGVDPAGYLDRPVDKEAQAYALVLARRAIASPLPKDVPQALSRGSLTGGNVSVGRSLGQFQNIFLDQWSNIRHDLWRAGIRESNPKKAAVMFLAIAGTVALETGIRESISGLLNEATGHHPKKERSVESKVITEAARRFPGGGQITSALLYGNSGVPILDSVLEPARATYKMATTSNPRTQNKQLIKAIGGAGTLLGVPGSSQGAELIEKSMN